jgi:hypothetical protein
MISALTSTLKGAGKAPPPVLPIYHGNATATDYFVADPSGQVWLSDGKEAQVVAHPSTPEGASLLLAMYGNPHIKTQMRWQ